MHGSRANCHNKGINVFPDRRGPDDFVRGLKRPSEETLKRSCEMLKLSWLGIPVLLATGFVGVWVTQTTAQEPTVALICRGELRTLRSDGGKVITTPFKWAKQPVAKENPGGGECAWMDRMP